MSLSVQNTFYVLLGSYVEGQLKNSEFHVFGWFPGLQNLHNSLKLHVFKLREP